MLPHTGERRVHRMSSRGEQHSLVLQIPLSDPRNGTQSCMPFFRSAPSCVAGSLSRRHREQLNAITSYVDASMVYGSAAALALALRNLSSPLGSMALNSQHSDQDLAYMPFLPRVQAHLDPCGPRNSSSHSSHRSERLGNNTSCFQAGEWEVPLWCSARSVVEDKPFPRRLPS